MIICLLDFNLLVQICGLDNILNVQQDWLYVLEND